MSKRFISIGVVIIVLLSAMLIYIDKIEKNLNDPKTAQTQKKTQNTEKYDTDKVQKTGNSETDNVVVGINVGDMAPDFTLEDLNGNKITLSKLKGKIVMVNFWATTCPYCRIEMPDINAFYKAHKGELEVLAVDLGESDSTIKDYIKDKGFEFKILKDTNGDVGYLYGIRFIPTTFFIDKKGVITAIANGAMTHDEISQYYSAFK